MTDIKFEVIDKPQSVPAELKPVAWCLAYDDPNMKVRIHSNPTMHKPYLEHIASTTQCIIVDLYAIPPDAAAIIAAKDAEIAEMQQELQTTADALGHANQDIERLERESSACDLVQQLRAALVSARDAQQLILTCKHGEFCEHYSVAEKAVKASLTGIDALLSGQPVEDPRDAKIASLQAKIDALMLEYCPDEITLEQMEEWASHQVVCEDPRDAVIEKCEKALEKAESVFEANDTHPLN